MLHFKAVEPDTISLLKELMAMPELNDFCLVGGTALAIKCEHRRSIDLDLFSYKKPDFKMLDIVLKNKFGEKYHFEQSHVTFVIFCYINNVKVDLVYSPHPQIDKTELIEGIRLYSNLEIAAMKINAILGRGSKKDFYDLAELFKEFSLEKMVAFHKKKYPSQMLLISIPNALVYFDEADLSDDPVSLNNITWPQVKNIIQEKVREYFK